MGGVNPMPTIAEKGPIFMQFDDEYAHKGKRLTMLMSLRTLGAGSDGVESPPTPLTEGDRKHIAVDWVGRQFTDSAGQVTEGSSWFRKLTFPTIAVGNKRMYNPQGKGAIVGLTPTELKAGGNQMREGIIEALEVSLGLAGPSSLNPLRYSDMNGNVLTVSGPDTLSGPTPRDLPLDIYWICGKADGFETIVSWNTRQVTVLITTPPTFWAACPLDASTVEYPAAKAQNLTVRRGMVVVRPDPASPVSRVKKILMAEASGGVNP